MIPFALQKVYRPRRTPIAAAQAGARYIAGGTTLVDLMREEVERPERLVDINALPLDYIRDDDGGLVIGALARMSDVAADATVQRLQPLIAETLIEGASPQLRNMASIGGNLLQRVRCPYFRMLDAPATSARRARAAPPGRTQRRPRHPRRQPALRRHASVGPGGIAGGAGGDDARARCGRRAHASPSRTCSASRETRRTWSTRCCPAS